MSFVISRNHCTNCGKPMVRDPLCSGDYYNTIQGYVLQEYCNGDCVRNGHMKPLVEGRDPDFIGNNMKKNVATRVAYSRRLGMVETKRKAIGVETNNLHEWIRGFARVMNMAIMDVESFVDFLG